MADLKKEKYGQIKDYPTGLFGDNEFFVLVDERPYYMYKGDKIKPMLIHPSPHLVKSYPEINNPEVKKIYTPIGYAVWKDYPVAMIHHNVVSRTNPVVRIDCGFDTGPTYETQKHHMLQEDNKALNREIDRLVVENEGLCEELRIVTAKRMEYEKHQQEIQDTRKPQKTGEDDYENHDNR